MDGLPQMVPYDISLLNPNRGTNRGTVYLIGIGGTDCGFSTFAGFGTVDEDIVYAKLGAMVEGSRLASQKLW